MPNKAPAQSLSRGSRSPATAVGGERLHATAAASPTVQPIRQVSRCQSFVRCGDHGTAPHVLTATVAAATQVCKDS